MLAYVKKNHYLCALNNIQSRTQRIFVFKKETQIVFKKEINEKNIWQQQLNSTM